MAKRGRPSKYKDEYAELAYKFTLLGAIDTDLAKFFEVSEKLINTWKKKHPDFLQSIKRGKAEADSEIVEALHKRASGYEWTEEGITKDGELVNVTKKLPPDVTAIIFWLKNRQPDKWRDRHEVGVSLETKETREKLKDFFDGQDYDPRGDVPDNGEALAENDSDEV